MARPAADRPDLTDPPADPDPSTVDAAEVARRLGTDPRSGLSHDEAARRLARYGPNQLTPARRVPWWRRFLGQFQDPLIYLLFAAGAVSGAVWLVEGATGWPVEMLVILAVVVLNAAIGLAQETRAEAAVAALRRMSATTASVVRGGEQFRVPVTHVVPGDLLVLAEGDAVAADARLVSASALTVLEASLTGESEPVLKDPATLPGPVPLAERTDMVFGGTAVAQGTGRAIVTATGMATEMGRIAGLLQRTGKEPTPLQREIGRLGRLLGRTVLAIAAVIVLTLLAVRGVDDPSDVVTVLLFGVALAVAAVPEGLPAILSMVLAIGVRRMAAHRAIVKRLLSVETLGSATVIASDKTGTLTRSEMTVERVVTASGECRVTGVGYRPDGHLEHDGAPLGEGPLRTEAAWVLGAGALASNAALHRDADGRWSGDGDPTDVAFVVAERKLEIRERPGGRLRRVGEIPFTSERRMMTALYEDAQDPGATLVVSKGAPDALLARCTGIRVGDRVAPLDERWRERVLADVDRLSAQAYRVIAVAYRRQPPDAGPVAADASVERDLVYAGTVGIIDPPRPEAAEAIRQARRAGIRIIMITGDLPRTAGRIAADLGLVEPGAPVLTGAELSRLEGADLVEAVRRTSVYARVAPADKLAIVDALQAGGAVVAMTGDGVNDAPALRSADIGVAMGRTGTEVTKEAADMILADDNFATIVEAVRRGRGIFDNIRKFLRFLLSSNAGEVLAVFLGVVLAGVLGLSAAGDGLALPLLVTQILWVNLVTDSTLGLAMGVDPEIEDVMSRPPRPLGQPIVDARMWAQVLVLGAVIAVATLLTIDMYLPGGLLPGTRDLDNARTAGFTVLVLAQLFNALNSRSGTASAFRSLFRNRWLWQAIALTALLQVAVVHLPGLTVAFGTVPLSPDQWLVCVAMAATTLVAGEVYKVVARRWAAART
ncbi:MAG: cation-translocating P-type ATPase [Micromonosporaceae bacterium]|jgi:Ca2+-transporting ATPase